MLQCHSRRDPYATAFSLLRHQEAHCVIDEAGGEALKAYLGRLPRCRIEFKEAHFYEYDEAEGCSSDEDEQQKDDEVELETQVPQLPAGGDDETSHHLTLRESYILHMVRRLCIAVLCEECWLLSL